MLPHDSFAMGYNRSRPRAVRFPNLDPIVIPAEPPSGRLSLGPQSCIKQRLI